MLICVECERVFDQPRHIVERHGLDTPPYEEYDACPYCFGTNIHPAKTCDVCGKWLTGGYIKTIDGQRIATTVIPRGMLGTNDPPLRYVEHAVTMAEAPLEISLTISVSNCAFRCHGCHSQYLQEDVGKPLLPDLESLIDRYKGLISCVCLMGEGRNPVE